MDTRKLNVNVARQVLKRPRIDEYEPSTHYDVVNDKVSRILSITRVKRLSLLPPLLDVIPTPYGTTLLELQSREIRHES